jgi:phosphoglycerate dehydrogenase-like enzyme
MRPVVGVVHYSDIDVRLRNLPVDVEWRSLASSARLDRDFSEDLDVLFLEVPPESWADFRAQLLAALPAMPRLRWIHVPASGVEWLLAPEIAASDVVVTNSAGVLALPIAEYILACVLSISKDLPRTAELQATASWSQREVASLRGARALIVGAGAIGHEAGRLLSAVGMTVTGVSIARGETIDMPALVRVLASQRVGTAIIDGFEHEPLPPDSDYWRTPGLIVSPHMSSATPDRTSRHVGAFAAHLDQYLAGTVPVGVDKRLGFVSHQPPAPPTEGTRSPGRS